MMEENYIIVGAGGFGRELLGWTKDGSRFYGELIYDVKVKGFLSDNPNILDGYSVNRPILGTPDDYEIQDNDVFLMAIGDVKQKKSVASRLEDRGAVFKSYAHPSCIISSTSKIGYGTVVGPFCLISDNVVLDQFVMMGFYASCGHDAHIGAFGILSPYATVNGFTVLEDEVFMGTHSSVIARQRVGKNSKISSGSVAMGSVPENSFVLGVPGKIQTIFTKES
jgi:sugar O-acyltransferase (sialic acid O-acetyltransferase NeuD family)